MGIMGSVDGNRFDPRGNYTIEQAIVTVVRTAFLMGYSPEGWVVSSEQIIFELVNEERRKAGVQPLEWAEPLARTARLHAEERARHNDTEHIGADGSSPSDRARRQGWTLGGVGENGAGPGSRMRTDGGWYIYPGAPARVIVLWLGSPVHRDNMLDPAFKYAGIGAARPVGDAYQGRIFLKLG